MSHFSDFMDGVPVKISEKYKRPPKIELPYTVNECASRAQYVVDSAGYDATFEKNVLSKLKELRSAKETKKNERRHRLQLLEEAKQKKLDAIAAAEAEEKLKQLSVSEVSYPSTDEFSAISPDEKTDKNCDIPAQDNSPEQTVPTNYEAYAPQCNAEPQLNILQPIQVQSNYTQGNLLDDPDPLQELKMTAKINKIPQYNQNIDTLTFKDFENDTSSPFDNVELKTINDMELLAQVLQSQKDSTTSCHPNQFVSEQTYVTNLPNCASQAQIEGMTYLPNAYMEQPVQGSVVYSPQHYPISNEYYVPNDNTCEVPYMSNYQYYVPTNPYPYVDQNYYSNQIPANPGVNQMPLSNGTTYTQPYYYQFPQMQMFPQNNTFIQNSEPTNDDQSPSTSVQNPVKSRSRSVPDIVKELDQELVSAKIRNERSYNASPAPKAVPMSSVTNIKKEEKKSRRRPEQLPNPYDKLPPKMQTMCQQIQTMGFPLDRVARVCTLIGDNNKKIIEGLLIIGELMDLGFPEGRVSAALAKHEFNRDKALDELVS